MATRNIRRLLAKAIVATAFCAVAGVPAVNAASADAYPSGPVTIVVPYPPGGATDNLSRVVADRLSQKWKESVVVDNRSGAGGLIGAEFVARAKPDGLTIMHTLSTLLQAPHLTPSTPVDPINDFEPITKSATNGLLLVTHSGVPAKTLAELVELAKNSDTKFSYGTYGVGSTAHLYGHLFAKQAGLDMVHIAYRGESPSVADLLGGQIPLVFMSGNGAKAHLATGRMRALAVTGPERSLVAPDVPTFKELGYKDMDVNGWYGFFAPKGTPPEIVSKISKDINEILADPAIQKNFRDIDIQLVGSTPEEFAKEMKPRYEMWGRLIKDAGIKVE